VGPLETACSRVGVVVAACAGAASIVAVTAPTAAAAIVVLSIAGPPLPGGISFVAGGVEPPAVLRENRHRGDVT
jgi:hypothetical protein